jgi:hypothetical protein
MVLNEEAVPSIYWQPGEPRLKRQKLATDLKEGMEVEGATLSNPEPTPERESKVMGFSGKQVRALQRCPDHRHIRTREVHGRELTYLEGWYAISEANRIFGFDGWSRETVESRAVLARENRGTFLAVYLARVRVTVQADGVTIIREGHGTGEGRGTSPGEVHDIALKAAETDATKRALATFGKPFGLELYRGGRTEVPSRPLPSPPVIPVPANPPLGFHPDDTTPIPRPSTYYGRRQNSSNEFLRADGRNAEQKVPSAAPPLAPTGPHPVPARIDKSLLPLAEPKRLRDKAHLKFVASQPCLVCERQPSDPHHLRFAQPRALGVKVSDEFTVPLCRGHHRQLHQAGNEAGCWKDLDINALEIAKGLWEQTHPKSAATIEIKQSEVTAGTSTKTPAET